MLPTYLSSHWNKVQQNLFPQLQETAGPLSEKHLQLVNVVEMVRFDDFIPSNHGGPGRPQINRVSLAVAFTAKAIYNLPTTRMLIDRLKFDVVLRRLCGFSRQNLIPDEATFSRAFSEFSKSALLSRIHEALINRYHAPHLVGHVSGDATAIEGHEKPAKKETKAKKKKPKKRGRPKKGQEKLVDPKIPTRLERQAAGMSLQTMLEDLPKVADVGCKKNSQGFTESWRGYKMHIASGDGEVPISCILTSASLHDSQVALPLMKMTENRVDYLYDVMDAAYDCKEIRLYSLKAGRKPLIDSNPRGGEKVEFSPHEAERYKVRTGVERVNSRLKGEFGGHNVQVRGHAKVLTHLMFGMVALTVDQLIRFVAS